MNKNQINMMEHAIRNQGRYYTDENCKDWNELVLRGYATKRGGWNSKSAYFLPTSKGKAQLKGILIDG